MKVKIAKTETREGDHFFKVRDEKGECLASFYFKPEVKNKESVMNEEYALGEATKFAARMESGEFDKDIEEIVYQTP